MSADTRAQEKRWAREPVTGEEMHVPAHMTYREREKKMTELRGADAVKTAEKIVRNESADREQWKRYRETIGK